MDAFNRAGAGAMPSQAEPEKIVENMTQDEFVEAGQSTPGLPVDHVEL